MPKENNNYQHRVHYAVTFTREALADPDIMSAAIGLFPGVEYILSDEHVRMVKERCELMSCEAFSNVYPIEPVIWDRKESLNGKKCLFISMGGIGDTLSHTAILGEAKRRYPGSSWTVFCQLGHHGNVWLQNPNIRGMRPFDFPLPKAEWDAHDFHFSTMGLIAQKREKEQPDFYDILSVWLFGKPIEPQWKRPEVYLHPREPLALWNYLMPGVNWTPDNTPKGHIIVQLNTSKETRNIPHETMIGIIKMLQQRYPNEMLFVFGEGKYAYEFAEKIKTETFFGFMAEGQLIPQVIFNLVDITSGKYRVPVIQTNWKIRGDLGIGRSAQGPNREMSVRSILALMRDSALVICPDSAFLHMAGANGISVPCVSLFTAFNPEWRCVTYPKSVAVWKKSACVEAPCSWHEDGWPEECPGKEARKFCAVAEAIEVGDVSKGIDLLFGEEK